MNVAVQFFGVTARLVGLPTDELHFDGDATTVEAALRVLAASCPPLAATLPRCACAVNDAIVNRHHALRDGDVLALLPPVSGG
jgi:molybdopterin converting factor small subunit